MPSWIYDPDTYELVPKDEYYARKGNGDKVSDLAFPFIRGDLPSYISPITGKPVEGRRARREELARFGCREVDPSEYKPTYKNYEFCQRNRLPYMGGDVPPPATTDEVMARKEAKKTTKAAKQAEATAPFLRGSPKSSPLFKNNTVKPS